MTPLTNAVTSTFPVGARFVCEAILVADRMPQSVRVEWSPHVPGKLSPTELADYRRGMDVFMAKVSDRISGGVTRIEL